MLRVFPMSLTGAVSHWLRNEPAGSNDTWETLKKKILSKYYPPTKLLRRWRRSITFNQSLTRAFTKLGNASKNCFEVSSTLFNGNAGGAAKKAIVEMADHFKKWHNGTSTRGRSTETFDGLATIQAQLNNLGRDIKKVNEKVYVAQVVCESCGGPYYTKDCQFKEEAKTFKEAYYTQVGVPYPQGGRYKVVMDVLDSATYSKMMLNERPKMGYQIKTSIDVNDLIVLKDSLPLKEKDPESFTLPCFINSICFDKALADLGATVSVMPLLTFTNLGLGELAPTKLTVELADRTIKHPKGITENLLVGIGLRERMDLDLEAMLMGKTLILNRSLDPNFGDFIEHNGLNEPLELKRNQVEDLGLMLEGCKVIDKPMIDIIETRNDDEMVKGINEYPSLCDYDRKIHMDCTYNLRFSCMIGFEHVDANFFLILSINIMYKKLYNSIMKVLENIDPYHDQEMGDVIVGEPFCREISVKARRFDGIITIYNDNNSDFTKASTYFIILTSLYFLTVSPFNDDDFLTVSPFNDDHLTELHYIAQCHTQIQMWIVSRGVVRLILLIGYKVLRDSKSVELSAPLFNQ
nr:hypothetical protein [Tanacetum cinerariifolium]